MTHMKAYLEAPDYQVIDVLRTAKHLLDRPGGWIQGSNHNYGGGFCAQGAILAAADVNGLPRTPVYFRILKLMYPKLQQSLTVFNDEPSTRQEDVVQLFDYVLDGLGASS